MPIYQPLVIVGASGAGKVNFVKTGNNYKRDFKKIP